VFLAAKATASTLSLMVSGKSAVLDGVMQSRLPEVGSQTAATAFDSAPQVVEGLEARAGIEPANKGFAV